MYLFFSSADQSQIALDITRAMEFLHAEKYVHNDFIIKNFQVFTDKEVGMKPVIRVKLADLSLCTPSPANEQRNRETYLKYKGTYMYKIIEKPFCQSP